MERAVKTNQETLPRVLPSTLLPSPDGGTIVGDTLRRHSRGQCVQIHGIPTRRDVDQALYQYILSIHRRKGFYKTHVVHLSHHIHGSHVLVNPQTFANHRVPQQGKGNGYARGTVCFKTIVYYTLARICIHPRLRRIRK